MEVMDVISKVMALNPGCHGSYFAFYGDCRWSASDLAMSEPTLSARRRGEVSPGMEISVVHRCAYALVLGSGAMASDPPLTTTSAPRAEPIQRRLWNVLLPYSMGTDGSTDVRLVVSTSPPRG